MASFLWGKVFFHAHYAGVLKEEAGECSSFTYDKNYLSQGHPAISYTLPLKAEPYFFATALPPFFDNLVAEGWLEHAQSRLLEKRHASRFELLLAFGADCIGAVSVIDPEPERLSKKWLNPDEPRERPLFTQRASLSGIQAKFAVIERNGLYFPTQIGELSTHIAKFTSEIHASLLHNEYLTTQALQVLLPQDQTAYLTLGKIEGISDQALIITRFDRAPSGRIHFEEFNSLLGRMSNQKYQGSYADMAEWLRFSQGTWGADVHRLFARIITGLLLGNTDMHLKNFAMITTPSGFRLTPSYDQVCSFIYDYRTIALHLAGIHDLVLTNLKAKHIIALAKAFEISPDALIATVESLSNRLDDAKTCIAAQTIGSEKLKAQLIQTLEKRWNGTFALIGKALSTKP